jgi:hypothetical protein
MTQRGWRDEHGARTAAMFDFDSVAPFQHPMRLPHGSLGSGAQKKNHKTLLNKLNKKHIIK